MIAKALLAWATASPPAIPPPPDPLTLELTWNAPAGCPDAAAIEGRIAELLRGRSAGEGVMTVAGEVVIGESGATLVLTTSFRGHDERRELAAADCSELSEATAVLLAVALEPGWAPPMTSEEAVASPSEASPGPVLDVAEDPIAPPATATPREPIVRAPARPPVEWAVRVGGGIEAGAVPPPSGVVHLATAVLWPRARLELHGAWITPRTRLVDDRSATMQLVSAGLRGCGRAFAGAIEFPLCVGAEAGAMHARGHRRSSGAQTGPWVAGLVSLGVTRAWGPVGVWAAAEVLGRVVGSRFEIGKTTIWRPTTVSGRLLVGIEIRPSWNRRKPDNGRT